MMMMSVSRWQCFLSVKTFRSKQHKLNLTHAALAHQFNMATENVVCCVDEVSSGFKCPNTEKC